MPPLILLVLVELLWIGLSDSPHWSLLPSVKRALLTATLLLIALRRVPLAPRTGLLYPRCGKEQQPFAQTRKETVYDASNHAHLLPLPKAN